MGQTIHQESSGTLGAVQALARRCDHILSNGGSESFLICDYFHQNKWHSVNGSMMVAKICHIASSMNLQQQGIDPDLIGAHSLHAGGAMALKLNGYNDTTIQKIGRWTSTTFLQYIHTQIVHLSSGVATTMSKDLPFVNVRFIEAPTEHLQIPSLER